MWWTREIAGWLLVACGLYIYLICFAVYLQANRAMSGAILAGIGTVVFRGGIHLIKVAAAARVVQQARRAAAPTIPATR